MRKPKLTKKQEKQYANLIKKTLSDKGLSLKKNPFALIKFARISTKIFNELCPECKRKVAKNPHMSYEDYCPRCREKVKPLLEELRKTVD